uniref:Uncharacterized protein n=1 Tax=Romanomermis culicivorax TaxID=13658 RepID=A0A915HGI2_ROMCU
MELRAILKNEITKLLSNSDSIDIDLICEQNWVVEHGRFSKLDHMAWNDPMWNPGERVQIPPCSEELHFLGKGKKYILFYWTNRKK